MFCTRSVPRSWKVLVACVGGEMRHAAPLNPGSPACAEDDGEKLRKMMGKTAEDDGETAADDRKIAEDGGKNLRRTRRVKRFALTVYEFQAHAA